MSTLLTPELAARRLIVSQVTLASSGGILFRDGYTTSELADIFHASHDTIRAVVFDAFRQSM